MPTREREMTSHSGTAADARERSSLYVVHPAIGPHGDTPPLLPSPDSECKPIGATVLIVDDNEEQLTALCILLDARGYVTARATSGSDALDQIASHAPDVLVVDAKLPDLSGPELIERAREHVSELPAILVSGYPAEHRLIAETIARARAAYIAKPIDLTTLYSELEKAVQGRASMHCARRRS